MVTILPRLIRQRDAPAYLGMDRNRFDAEVRPEITEIPLGKRAIAYDRLELDAWADAYIAAYGRPGRKACIALAGVSPAAPAQALLPAAAPDMRSWKPPKSGAKRSTFDRAMESCFAPNAVKPASAGGGR